MKRSVIVLFAHNNADMYGSSRSLVRLALKLSTDGHSVYAVLPYDGPLRQCLEQGNVKVLLLPGMAIVERDAFKSFSGLFSFIVRLPVSVFRFIRFVHQIKPDIIHSNTSVTLPSALAAKINRIPHVWHIREFYTDFPRFWGIYQRLMVFFSSRIVCVSTAVQSQFGRNTKPTTTVLHNGFPEKEFRPVSQERVQLFKSQYNLNGKKLVGVIGRLKCKRKGQETFVEAAKLIAPKYPDVCFVLIGSAFPGNESHEVVLREQAAPLGDRVVFTGDVEDIKAAYVALDVVVMPSGQPEPFGGVVIEAMALERPVVATAIGGTVEQVVDGETGFLVPPNDSKALATAIEKLLGHPESAVAMGRAGKKRFHECFEFDLFYPQMMSIYNNLVSGRHSVALNGDN